MLPFIEANSETYKPIAPISLTEHPTARILSKRLSDAEEIVSRKLVVSAPRTFVIDVCLVVMSFKACPFRRDGSAATIRLLQVSAKRRLACDPHCLENQDRCRCASTVGRLSLHFLAHLLKLTFGTFVSIVPCQRLRFVEVMARQILIE